MLDPSSLIAMLIASAIVLPLILLISATLLRAGVSLYNRLVGGPESPKAVPEPTFKKAVGISLIVCLVNYAIGALMGMGATLTEQLGARDLGSNEIVSIAASFVVGTLVLAACCKFMLPTRLPRAIGVSLCNSAVTACFAALIFGIGFSISVAMAAMM